VPSTLLAYGRGAGVAAAYQWPLVLRQRGRLGAVAAKIAFYATACPIPHLALRPLSRYRALFPLCDSGVAVSPPSEDAGGMLPEEAGRVRRPLSFYNLCVWHFRCCSKEERGAFAISFRGCSLLLSVPGIYLICRGGHALCSLSILWGWCLVASMPLLCCAAMVPSMEWTFCNSKKGKERKKERKACNMCALYILHALLLPAPDVIDSGIPFDYYVYCHQLLSLHWFVVLRRRVRFILKRVCLPLLFVGVPLRALRVAEKQTSGGKDVYGARINVLTMFFHYGGRISKLCRFW
jgi:hypothetical protein